MWIALSLSLALAGEPWSRFRGPNGTGVVETTGLPSDPGAEGALRWRVEVPRGHSSPVLSDNAVFLTGHAGDALLTIALAREDGRELWRKEAPRPRREHVDERNDAASPSPVVAGERVVVFFPDFGLLAYGTDGEELWRHPLGPFDNLYGMGASPIVVDDRVVLACDQSRGSFVAAFALQDGRELWRTSRPTARSGHCTPVEFRPAEGGAQIVLPGSFTLDAYDAASGERVWWVRGLPAEMKSVPVLDDGVVYTSGYASPLNQPGNQVEVPDFERADADGDGGVTRAEVTEPRVAPFFDYVDLDHSGALEPLEWEYLRDALASLNGMLAVRAGGTGDRTEEAVLWTHRQSVPQLPSPVLFGGRLFMPGDQGGIVTVFAPTTGEVSARGRIEGLSDALYASPVAGDGKLYLASLSGLLFVLPADGALKPLSITDLDEEIYATPALSRGRLFVRTVAALYCFGT